MTSLYETAKAFQRKDITSLSEIPLKDIEVRDGLSEDGKIKYKYIEINGWKYTVKSEVLEAIQEVINVRPLTTKVKVYKDKEGKLKVMPLD